MKVLNITTFLKRLILIIAFLQFGCAKWLMPPTNKPEDPAYISLYSSVNNSEVKDSIILFQKALSESPCISPKLYIDGIKMYNSLINKIDDDRIKEACKDSVMSLYDKRLVCFPVDSIDIMNRKAYNAYVFYSGDEQKLVLIYELFFDTYKSSGHDFLDINILPYFDIARRSKLASHNFTEKEFFDLYDQLSMHIDYRINHGADKEKMGELKEVLSELLRTGTPVSCEFVENVLLSKLEPKYWNVKLANNVLRLAMNCEPKDTVFIRKVIDRFELCGYKEQAVSIKEHLAQIQ